MLSAAVESVHDALAAAQGKLPYEALMNLVIKQVTAWGLELAVNNAVVFSPVPYYAWDKPLQRSSQKNKIWGFNKVKEKSVAVNNWWQSSRYPASTRKQDRSAAESGSMWAQLLAYVERPKRPLDLQTPLTPAEKRSRGQEGGDATAAPRGHEVEVPEENCQGAIADQEVTPHSQGGGAELSLIRACYHPKP